MGGCLSVNELMKCRVGGGLSISLQKKKPVQLELGGVDSTRSDSTARAVRGARLESGELWLDWWIWDERSAQADLKTAWCCRCV